MSDKTFVYEDNDDTFLCWQNSECDEEDVVEMYIDIFFRNENGTYSRHTDSITERAYSVEFLRKALEKSGFNVLGIYGDMTTLPPEENEERLYFLAEKK